MRPILANDLILLFVATQVMVSDSTNRCFSYLPLILLLFASVEESVRMVYFFFGHHVPKMEAEKECKKRMRNWKKTLQLSLNVMSFAYRFKNKRYSS